MNPQVNPEIFIITGPVGIGKSTMLRHFFREKSFQTVGFLCDADPSTKLRTLCLFPDEKSVPFEVPEASESTLSIGKFHFKNGLSVKLSKP